LPQPSTLAYCSRGSEQGGKQHTPLDAGDPPRLMKATSYVGGTDTWRGKGLEGRVPGPRRRCGRLPSVEIRPTLRMSGFRGRATSWRTVGGHSRILAQPTAGPV
jgi:hypothetical protein